MIARTAADIGKFGEKLAARYLRRNGYRIVARNLRLGHLELDLIVRNRECLAFVEIKTRRVSGTDSPDTVQRPAFAVDYAKRRRTAEATIQYLREHPTHLCKRFDVVEVYLGTDGNRIRPLRIHHIPDAFRANGAIRP